MSKLLGVFGGTFNPIHKGHIEPVKQAAEQLAINTVLILPCAIPPHRNAPKVSAQHRLAMTALAVENESLFTVDDRELKRDKPSYTRDTLMELQAAYPDHTLCFFIGSDSLMQFDTWYQWQEILSLCHLIVCRRTTDQSLSDLNKALASRLTSDPHLLANKQAGLVFLAETEKEEISSTYIRDKLGTLSENSIEKLKIHPAVAKYIQQHQLYR